MRVSVLTTAIISIVVVFVVSCWSDENHRSATNDLVKKNDTIPEDQDQYTPIDENIRLVPDSATAIALAEIIFRTRFKSNIDSRKPFTATEYAEYWYVSGTLPPMMVGGVPYLRIAKHNAAVLSLGHGR